MKTTSYNPSTIEVEFAETLVAIKEVINENLTTNKIIRIEFNKEEDNPRLIVFLEDTDGDPHELVVKLIQRVDK